MFRLIRRRQKTWSNWKWLRRLVAMKTRLHQRIGCISSCHWIVYLRAKRLTGEIVGCVGYICRGQHWRRQVEIRSTIRNQEWSYESGCWVMGLVIGCTGLLCTGATQESTIGREGEPIKPRTGGGPNDPHPRVDCYVTSSLWFAEVRIVR